jgi:hypothetical protein
MGVLAKLGGRKFVVAVFGALAVGLQAWLGIDPDVVGTLGTIVAAYLFGQGIADGLSGGATSSSSVAARIRDSGGSAQ